MKAIERRMNQNEMVKTINANFVEASLLAGETTLVASQLLATGTDKAVKTLAVATYPSLAEIAYVKGVTSAIQTQLDAKAAAATTPVISSGVIAPASTPAKVGNIYVDTVAGKLYFAKGTATSADWVIAN